MAILVKRRWAMTLLIGAAAYAATATADVHERINDCEASGGRACIFDLLRELANSSGSTTDAPAVPPLVPGRYDGDDYYARVEVTSLGKGRFELIVTMVERRNRSELDYLTYECEGSECKSIGEGWTNEVPRFSIVNRRAFTMNSRISNYGREWVGQYDWIQK